MKIFLSWSGPASQKCAELLASWLPYFSDEIEPFVSSESIRKGARGLTELKEQLDQSSFGIACITRANIDAPWITFESGALSKEVDEHRGLVVPFLLEGTHKDLELANSPLRQFSSTQADDPADVLKMVKAISAVLRESANRPPDDIRVKNLFDMVWPMLRDGLAAIDLTADRAEQDPPRRRRRRCWRSSPCWCTSRSAGSRPGAGGDLAARRPHRTAEEAPPLHQCVRRLDASEPAPRRGERERPGVSPAHVTASRS